MKNSILIIIIYDNVFMTDLSFSTFTFLQIFLGLLWLYCIILTTSYSSNLIAFLTIPRRSKAFDTLEGLFNSGLTIFEFGTAPHSIYAEPLSKSTDPVNVVSSSTI